MSHGTTKITENIPMVVKNLRLLLILSTRSFQATMPQRATKNEEQAHI